MKVIEHDIYDELVNQNSFNGSDYLLDIYENLSDSIVDLMSDDKNYTINKYLDFINNTQCSYEKIKEIYIK